MAGGGAKAGEASHSQSKAEARRVWELSTDLGAPLGFNKESGISSYFPIRG